MTPVFFDMCCKCCETGWGYFPVVVHRGLAVCALDHDPLSLNEINFEIVTDILVEIFFHQYR